jgi:hypothetical protein
MQATVSPYETESRNLLSAITLLESNAELFRGAKRASLSNAQAAIAAPIAPEMSGRTHSCSINDVIRNLSLF